MYCRMGTWLLCVLKCRGLVPEACTEHHHYTMVLFGVLGHLEPHAPSVYNPPPPPPPLASSSTPLVDFAALLGCGPMGMGLGMRLWVLIGMGLGMQVWV